MLFLLAYFTYYWRNISRNNTYKLYHLQYQYHNKYHQFYAQMLTSYINLKKWSTNITVYLTFRFIFWAVFFLFLLPISIFFLGAIAMHPLSPRTQYFYFRFTIPDIEIFCHRYWITTATIRLCPNNRTLPDRPLSNMQC